jgi:hypothetical protein
VAVIRSPPSRVAPAIRRHLVDAARGVARAAADEALEQLLVAALQHAHDLAAHPLLAAGGARGAQALQARGR